MKIKQLLVVSIVLLTGSFANAADRPNLLFIMMDDLGYGHCQFNNGVLTVAAFDPYFKELVAQRQDYTPEMALDFSKRAMPTLSRMGKEGVVFTRAYAPANVCAPSRLAIATGKSLPQLGIYSNQDVENSGLQPGTHLAHNLQDAGYATAHIGKWHVGRRDGKIVRDAMERHGVEGEADFWALRDKHPDAYDEAWEAGYYGSVVKEQNPLNNGFDYYYGYNTWASQFYDSPLVWENFKHAGRQAGYNTEVFTDKAIGFMGKQVEAGKPFFVQLHYHAVHDWLQPNAPDRYRKLFLSPSYDLSNFYGHVYAVDKNIQRILDYLKKHNQLENTLVVFTSDNGAMAGGPSVLPANAPFSGHKGMFNQGGIRIPLLFYWPKGIKMGKTLDHIVSSMDILPTFIEAAGLDVPDGLEAKSLLPMLNTENAAPVRDQMIWAGVHARRWGFLINTSFKNHYTELPFAPGGWAVVKGNYVLRFTGSFGPQVYHEAPAGSGPRVALYNYVDDPAETKDLKDQMPELAETLRAEYLKQTPGYKPPATWDQEKWKEIAGEAAK